MPLSAEIAILAHATRRMKTFTSCIRASSSAALVVENMDQGSAFLNINEKTQLSRNTQGRPRLAALRKTLKNDTIVVSTSSAQKSGLVINQHQATDNTKGCGSSSYSSTQMTPEDNLATIIRIIEDLKKEKQREESSYQNKFNSSPAMLTDKFGRYHTYLRISLTERCNLRCQYCMPPEGVPLQPKQSLLDSNEVLQLVNLFASKGVNKIRLTGGEPLLRHDIVPLIRQISSCHPDMQSVGITTNGLTLSRKLQDLIDAGLTHVNISLDTLQENKFLEITRRKGLSMVMEAIEKAANMLPSGRVKVNCVVMKGFNDNELKDFVRLAKHLPVDIRFIEWMPFNDNGWNANRFFSYADMLKCIQDEQNLERAIDSPNDTTKWYTIDGYQGRVGFITSMSDHFCGTCNRLRITADGQLKVCLFGSDEVSLRDAIRAGIPDSDLELLVEASIKRKKYALGGHGDMHGIKEANSNRPMTLIGG